MNSKTKLATLTALLALATVPQALAPTSAGAVAVQTTSACTQVTTPTGGVVLQCPVVTGGTVEAYRVRNDRDFAYPVGELPRCYKNPAACGPQAIGGRGSVTDRDLHIGGGPAAKGWRPQARRSKKSGQRAREANPDPYKDCLELKQLRGNPPWSSQEAEIKRREWEAFWTDKDMETYENPLLKQALKESKARLDAKVVALKAEIKTGQEKWEKKNCVGVLGGIAAR